MISGLLRNSMQTPVPRGLDNLVDRALHRRGSGQEFESRLGKLNILQALTCEVQIYDILYILFYYFHTELP